MLENSFVHIDGIRFHGATLWKDFSIFGNLVQYKEDPLTSAYASDLEEFILEYQPLYWIHGHIHTHCRYKIDATEIICNPHGYIEEKYNGYDKELIIEV